MSHASRIRLWLEQSWSPSAVVGKTPRDCMVRAHELSGMKMEIDDFVATMLDMGFNPKCRSPGEDRWLLDLPKLTDNTDHLTLDG